MRNFFKKVGEVIDSVLASILIFLMVIITCALVVALSPIWFLVLLVFIVIITLDDDLTLPII